MTDDALKAPFPWFGGKRRVADDVWQQFGSVDSYCEPFAGSLAVLLGRPEPFGGVETVNDLDGFIANAWRAIAADPDEVAHFADWPVNETDLHARHIWLVEHAETLNLRLLGDPDYFDAKVAGWWLWGISAWIGLGGGGWCSGDGPWTAEGIVGERQLVHSSGSGVGVRRNRPHLSGGGQGVHRQRVQLGDGLGEWMQALSERLRFVRVCSGDGKRVVTPAALMSTSKRKGIFLDPPYDQESRAICYNEDSPDIFGEVRAWCLDAPAEYRIALCGYDDDAELVDAGWEQTSWVASGGMGNQGKTRADEENRHRERIWYSPSCLGAKQAEMFAT